METAFADVFAVGSEFIKRLAYASDVEIADAFGDLGNTVTIVTNDAKIYIPLGDLVDFEAEAKRLQRNWLLPRKSWPLSTRSWTTRAL